MVDFKYKNLLQLKALSLEELEKYERQLRAYECDNNKPLESSEFKKRIYFLTNLILKIDRITTGRKLIIFDDKRSDTSNKGKVYATTHVGRYDIESAMEAINEQLYFIMGDPGETYRNFEGLFLDKLQGRICLDTGYNIHDIFVKKMNGENLTLNEQELYEEYKKDRYICEIIATRRVARGDNILVFPGACWNTTERIVQPIFDGAVSMAVNGCGLIIPIGVLRDGKTYSVNIGEEMNVVNATDSDIKDITKELREKMCSLVGEMVFASDKLTSRASMGTPEENLEAFVSDIMSESENGYTREVIENSRFYDKNAPENVFALKRTKKALI